MSGGERDYAYRTRITIDVHFRATDNPTAFAQQTRIANALDRAGGDTASVVEKHLFAEWER